MTEKNCAVNWYPGLASALLRCSTALMLGTSMTWTAEVKISENASAGATIAGEADEYWVQVIRQLIPFLSIFLAIF